MAADSAVTISAGRQGLKTYDTANKLFELIKGRPVGVMVYSNAEMNGVPWETIVKLYSMEQEHFVAPTTAGYVDDFISFLNGSASPIFTEMSEDAAFELIAYELLVDVAQPIIEGITGCMTKTTGHLIKARLTRLVDESIGKLETRVNDAPLGPWTGLSISKLRARYALKAQALIEDIFSEFGLVQSRKNRLVNLLLNACTKDLPTGSDAGLVIGGFGTNDPFPTVHAVHIRGRLAGITRVSPLANIRIDQEVPGAFRTFAQDESALQFVTGINTQTRHEIVHFWREWINESSKELRTSITQKHPRLAKGTVSSLTGLHRDLAKKAMDAFVEHMNEHQQELFVAPFVRSIAFLPKDELAHMAESLVNLTSMSQRFSVYQNETVGGQIDVALISRGDGLVWIKRKDYFSLELNPAWPMTHSGRIPTASDAS